MYPYQFNINLSYVLNIICALKSDLTYLEIFKFISLQNSHYN